MARIFARMFGIDVRSLAVFRIGLGALLLADLAVRTTDLEAHYSDLGVLPRDFLSETMRGTWKWSLHIAHGSSLFQAMLFLVAAIAAFALMLGYRSRLASVVSWVLLFSLQTRNPLVNNGGDMLLRALLFWAMFLPLDQCWSLKPNAAHSNGPRRPFLSPRRHS